MSKYDEKLTHQRDLAQPRSDYRTGVERARGDRERIRVDSIVHERSGASILATIRRLLQRRIETIEKRCENGQPTDDDIEDLIKIGRGIASMEPRAEPVGGGDKKQESLADLTDAELAARLGKKT